MVKCFAVCDAFGLLLFIDVDDHTQGQVIMLGLLLKVANSLRSTDTRTHRSGQGVRRKVRYRGHTRWNYLFKATDFYVLHELRFPERDTLDCKDGTPTGFELGMESCRLLKISFDQ
jgi:hypothetical protein